MNTQLLVRTAASSAEELNANLHDTQVELELLFDKNQTLSRVKKEFSTDDMYAKISEAEMDQEFIINLLSQMVLHKRTSLSTLVGILYRHFEPTTIESTQETRTAAMQLCADTLERAVELDFLDWSIEREEFITRYKLLFDTKQDLERYQYPLPMVVPPRTCRNNRDNGYLSSSSLLVLKGSRTKSRAYETGDICLDHINRVNATPLRMNHDVVAFIDNSWSDLDKQKDDETIEDYHKRVKAFDKYDRSSKDVIAGLGQVRDQFWLTHKYDRRGRIYCQGYHVNYQGNEWNKACVEFAEQEIVPL